MAIGISLLEDFLDAESPFQTVMVPLGEFLAQPLFTRGHSTNECETAQDNAGHEGS